MHTLSQSLQTFLTTYQLKYINFVHKNENKKTAVIVVEKSDYKYIIKSIDDTASESIREKFCNEVKFYQNNDLRFIPKYIHSNENVLQLEYIDGITFRNHLLKDMVTDSQIKSLFDETFELYTTAKKDSNHVNYSKVHTHLAVLATSGPIQTKDMFIPLSSKIMNWTILQVLKYKLHHVLKHIDIAKLRNGFSHGDLHYNNILITNSGVIKLIDFENVNYNGVYDFDLIYLFVMVELYIMKDQFNSIKKEIISKICEDEKALINIIDIYRLSILLNKKFHIGCQVRASKLKLLYKALAFQAVK